MTSRRLFTKQTKWLTLGDIARDLPELIDVAPRQIRDLRSALNQLAKVANRPLVEIPADPVVLQKIRETASWQQHMSKKRWANVVSAIGGLLYDLGVLSMRSRQQACLLPEWQQRLNPAPKKLRHSLTSFGRWSSRNGITPDQVTPDTFSRYAEELQSGTMLKRPRDRMHSARRAWNEAVKVMPGWPQLHVPSPEDAQCYSLPWSAFPPSLQQEVERYRHERAQLHSCDIFDERRSIKVSTIEGHLLVLRRYASMLVLSGVPIEILTSLEKLLEPDLVKRGLRRFLSSDGKKTPKASQAFFTLVSIARFLELPDEDVKRLKKLGKKLRPPRASCMNPRNRMRLAPLKNPTLQAHLRDLPYRIAKELKAVTSPTYKHAVRMRLAVAVEIEKFAPLRVSNLAGLDLEQNLNSPAGAELYIFIPASDVKNNQEINLTLPPASRALIDDYRKRFRPLLLKTPSTALFPCRNGGAMSGHALGRCISDGLRRELGLIMNPHLFRHFAAYLYLKRHPGDYETIRRLLGHTSIHTTIAFYAEMEQEQVATLFHAVVVDSEDTSSDDEEESPF